MKLWVLGGMLFGLSPLCLATKPQTLGIGQSSLETTSDQAPDKYRHAMGLEWRNVFASLVDRSEWKKAIKIEHLGETNFSSDPFWNTPSFQFTWKKWKRQKAEATWLFGDDKVSIWRLAEGHAPNRASLGLRRERDGTWWAVWIKPQTVLGRPEPAWDCPSSGCIVTLTEGSVSRPITLKAPSSSGLKTKTYTVGHQLDTTRLPDGVMTWTITLPGEATSQTFDLSYARIACRSHMLNCF